ncbi:MAG TPA: CHAT domain-containing tetratricopeptide repeat protein [Pyrinomonadaceae bacterium]|nr:CHAT domain-containing tetratricopeptide repeat protein [Pyrinomonadaceae bacterium]
MGAPVEREIASGQKHLYQLTLMPGQFIKVEVRQLSAEVRISLIPPDGKTIPVLDSFLHDPLVHVERVVDQAGTYRVEIYTRSKVPTGRYEIRLAELRPATENDRALEEAQESLEKAMVLMRTDKFTQAAPLWTRVIELRERVLGPDSLEVAEALSSLGVVYEHMSDYASAEPLLQRALRIKEKIRGPEHPAVADLLRSLGDLYLSKGDDVQAEELLQKARGIFERTQAETINLAALLRQLGEIYYARHDYQKSESYFRQSMAILERLLGPDHYHLVDSFAILGHVAYDAGDYAKAEPLFQKALTITEKALGPQNLKVAGFLNDLAMLYSTTGNYQKAEELYQRALAIHELQGMADENARDTPLGLARLNAARGQLSEAVRFQTLATDIEERSVGLNLAVGSEREKLALLDSLSRDSSRNISLHADLDPNDPKALELAANTILRHKGRVQDAMSAALAGLHLRLGPEDQKLLDQLNEANGRLANLVLSGPQKASPTEYQDQIRKLEERRGSLEDEISRRTSGFYQASRPVTVAAIQQAIPRDAALIEFAVYRPFDPKAPDPKAFGEPRYVAYVIRSQGEVRWQKLGTVKEIDAGVSALRLALRDPQRHDVERLARVLDEQVMAPVRALTGDATQLLISPDGQLNLIPFAALLDESGRYLIQRFALVYLTSGRDLLHLRVARTGASQPLVITNPLFGDAAGKLLASTNHPTRPAALRRRSVVAGSDLADVYFAPLSGTAQEGLSIQAVFPEVNILSGAQATEAALKQANAPRVLHIATHGFFLTDSGSLTSMSAGEKTRSITTGPSRITNPLLRSGLALANANLRNRVGDDGILTALEATGLNLWGTKLVVLSACDTGIGEVRNGEGVYGLRRAFVIAGAESLVMSLWPVSDYTTRTLMTSYYRNLKQGLGRADALRRVQLELLQRNPKLHPFYWASFIQSGEWAPLER